MAAEKEGGSRRRESQAVRVARGGAEAESVQILVRSYILW